MNTQNIINAVLLDLSLENLILQDTLQASLNSDGMLEHKVAQIKNNLSKLINNESMISRFKTLVKVDENNNEVK